MNRVEAVKLMEPAINNDDCLAYLSWNEAVTTSIAISMKRIADALTGPDVTSMNLNAILYEIMQNGVPRA